MNDYGLAEITHGSLPLYQSADYCGHGDPPPESEDDGNAAWDAYHDNHPNSSGFDGEPICLLTPAGEFCPACTDVAREEEDLPLDEYMECRLGTGTATAAGEGRQ